MLDIDCNQRNLVNIFLLCHNTETSLGLFMDRPNMKENIRTLDGGELSSSYIPPLELTEGQPPPIAANGGLSYMSFVLIQYICIRFTYWPFVSVHMMFTCWTICQTCGSPCRFVFTRMLWMFRLMPGRHLC